MLEEFGIKERFLLIINLLVKMRFFISVITSDKNRLNNRLIRDYPELFEDLSAPPGMDIFFTHKFLLEGIVNNDFLTKRRKL